MPENYRERQQRAREEKYLRGSSYRYDFIRENPGFHGYYICRYCGKLLKKDRMTVDHRIPVRKAETSWLYRKLLDRYPYGVNDVRNLVPACERCNKRKGSKTGIWLLLGYTGVVTGPLFRVAVTALAAFAVYLAASALLH